MRSREKRQEMFDIWLIAGIFSAVGRVMSSKRSVIPGWAPFNHGAWLVGQASAEDALFRDVDDRPRRRAIGKVFLVRTVLVGLIKEQLAIVMLRFLAVIGFRSVRSVGGGMWRNGEGFFV